MANNAQQNYEQNFAEDQQYNEYNEQNYSEAMDEGSGEQSQEMNGNVDGQVPPKSPTDEDRKLFIGGLSWDTDQKDLKEYFSKYGEVTDVTIKTDPATGKSRGFGFLTFAVEETVNNVLKNVPHTIKGKQVDPKRAKARPGIKKIFVGGLDNDYPEAEIKAYFEKYGKVESVELPFDKVKNQRRQFCFVTFETEDACEAACKQSKQKIGNKDCDIKKATNKPDPRVAGRGGPGAAWGGAFAGRGGGRGRGVRGRGGPGFSQPQGWNAPGFTGGYSGQGYGYNQGYGGGYGNYDYGYGGGYGSGYGSGYDYTGGWNYNQGGNYTGTGYGQQPSAYGKTPRRGAATGASTNAYHPYSR